MPRNPGTGIYTQPDVDVVAGTPIESDVYNAFVHDVATEFNSIRPIIAGGTGDDDIAGVLFNVGGEAADQLVTNYDTFLFVPGSFRSAAGATGAPNAHAFAGICYVNEPLTNPPANQNVILEARDEGDTTVPGTKYTREKKAGVWGAWVADPGSVEVLGKVNRSGDTLTGFLMAHADPQTGPQVATKHYVDAFLIAGGATPLDALSSNGMQINGGMEISQERGTTAVVSSAYNTSGLHLVDAWKMMRDGVGGTTPAVLSIAQVNASGDAPPGFNSYLNIAVTTGQPVVGSDSVDIRNQIEGYRFARMAWGTSSALPLTIGFWMRATVPGYYRATIVGAGITNTPPLTFSITNASVWQWVPITFPARTNGTWGPTTGAIGVRLHLYDAATANSFATTGNTISVTGLVVLPGNDMISAARSPLIQRPYGQELELCKRYYQKIVNPPGSGAANGASVIYYWGFPLPVAMRIAPAPSMSGNMTWASPSANYVSTTVLNTYCTPDTWLVNLNATGPIPAGVVFTNGGNTGSAAIADARL